MKHEAATTVFAALGPNPAPLAELVWKLGQEGTDVRDAFIVVDARGADYLRRELLDGGVLDELRAHGCNVTVHERLVEAPAGVVLDDDNLEHADVYNAAIWDGARAAIEHAGDGAVVFGLCAGRRRTMTAMSTMAFQLLARPQDRCLDVRVSDRRAEGGGDFYFPTQRAQALVSRQGEAFVARDVGVKLIDVKLPRLRGLLTNDALSSYASALTAGQDAVDDAGIPLLTVDLLNGQVLVDDEPVALSLAMVVWVAALALARREDSNDGWIATTSMTHLTRVAAACVGRMWTEPLQSKPILFLLGNSKEYKNVKDLFFQSDIVKLKADTRKKMTAWCAVHRPKAAALLVPEAKRWKTPGERTSSYQRVALPPERVRIVGLGS
jgi:CRISPR-associated protein (TIGR02584 family)